MNTTHKDKYEPYPLNLHEIRIAFDVASSLGSQIFADTCKCLHMFAAPVSTKQVYPSANVTYIHKFLTRVVETHFHTSNEGSNSTRFRTICCY